MEKIINVHTLLINRSDIDGLEAYSLIEKIAMSGNIPRPVVRAGMPIYTSSQTLLYLVGAVGNYHNDIINTLSKKYNCDVSFISDDAAKEIEFNQDIYH